MDFFSSGSISGRHPGGPDSISPGIARRPKAADLDACPLSYADELPADLVIMQMPTSGLGWSLKFCIYNKFLDNTNPAGPRTTLWLARIGFVQTNGKDGGGREGRGSLSGRFCCAASRKPNLQPPFYDWKLPSTYPPSLPAPLPPTLGPQSEGSDPAPAAPGDWLQCVSQVLPQSYSQVGAHCPSNLLIPTSPPCLWPPPSPPHPIRRLFCSDSEFPEMST